MYVCWTKGHVWRTDDGYIGERVVRMEQPGKRKREGLRGVYGCGDRGHGNGGSDGGGCR